MKTRKNIQELKPYVCARYTQAPEDIILMDANEMPTGEYNRYPDPLAVKLRTKLAEYVGADLDNFFVGNGSDEAIDLLIRIYCEPGVDSVWFNEPTYGMYGVAAAINNVEVAKDGAKMVFLCSPNNPTGEVLSEGEVRAYCGGGALVVLDEAYVEFSTEGSLVRMIEEFPNLVVLRTMSKAWGAAGIRLGYAVGDARVIAEMNKVKAPYNVNQLTQEKALEILEQEEQMKEKVTIIVAERERLAAFLNKSGFKVWSSQANFLLFEAPEGTFQKLLDGGVLVRDLSSKIANALRVTVGTREQNDQFINILF